MKKLFFFCAFFLFMTGMTMAGVGPTVTTTAATNITTNSATLNGTVNANNYSVTVTFEYGLNIAYGSTVAGVPGTVTGNTVTPVSADISGLLPCHTYHYRVNGAFTGGTAHGSDMTFTTDPEGAGPITGTTPVCQGANGVAYSIAPIPNATSYNWSLPGGATIATGLNTNSITVDFSPSAVSGYITVYAIFGCGNGAPSQMWVTVNPCSLGAPIPTLTQWGLIILGFALLGLGTVYILRRRRLSV